MFIIYLVDTYQIQNKIELRFKRMSAHSLFSNKRHTDKTRLRSLSRTHLILVVE